MNTLADDFTWDNGDLLTADDFAPSGKGGGGDSKKSPTTSDQNSEVDDFFKGDSDSEDDNDDLKLDKKVEDKDDEKNKSEDEDNDPEDSEDEGLSVDDFLMDDSEEADSDEDSPHLSDGSYLSVYNRLKEEGLFEEDEDVEELSEEDFFEKLKSNIDKEIESEINEFASSLDEDAAAFLQFKRSGGSTSDFFKLQKSISQVPEVIDGDENSYKEFMKYYLSTQEGLEYDEVVERIEFFEERGRLEANALKYSEKLNEKNKASQQKLLEEQKQKVVEQEKRRKESVKNLKQIISTNDEIKDWKLSPKDKKELPKYMTAPVEKTSNGYVTEFQRDFQKALTDQKKLVLIAKLIKSDFDISEFKKIGESEMTKKTKRQLNNSKVIKKSKAKTKLENAFDHLAL